MNSLQSLDEYRRRMCLAMNYISRHLDENPALEEIAAAAHFSKYHFHNFNEAGKQAVWEVDICCPVNPL